MTLNAIHRTGLFQYPLKRGNIWFSDIFKGIYKETSALKWVKDIFTKYVLKMLTFMLVPQQNMLSYSRSALVLLMQEVKSFNIFWFQDALKAFYNFKTKFDMWKYMICKSIYILKVNSIHYTLRKNTIVKSISFGQDKRYKKYTVFSFAIYNSPQFYF